MSGISDPEIMDTITIKKSERLIAIELIRS
jgi:hypothetical protein